jgi:glycosyltransferase involved in cell wall biosynthesis
MIAYTTYAFDARVRREAETLAAHGFQVRCLTTAEHGEPKRTSLNGVEILELGVRKYRGKSTVAYLLSYLRFLLSASRTCARYAASGELDVLHVHNIPNFLVLAGLAPRLLGSKVVLDVHDSVPETYETKFGRSRTLQLCLRLEERLSARLAHKVICVNHPQCDVLVGRGIPASKTFVSMNVPDPGIFKPVLRRVAARGGLDLVYHGTMAERLGVDLIIRAVAQVRQLVPEVRLHLWGGGDDVNRFQTLARELGLDTTVSFRPQGVPLHDLPQQLSGMDIGIVGNRRNSATELMLPVKLMEYVALGIPAVVPRLTTIAHYFSDEMVTYYEPEDVDSLAAAVLDLHRDAERRRAQAAAAAAFLLDHGWETRGGELVALYQELVRI